MCSPLRSLSSHLNANERGSTLLGTEIDGFGQIENKKKSSSEGDVVVRDEIGDLSLKSLN